MGLLQWNKVFKLGEDEVLRPPVVALKIRFPIARKQNMLSGTLNWHV